MNVLKLTEDLEKQAENCDHLGNIQKIAGAGRINRQTNLRQSLAHSLDMRGLQRREKKRDLVWIIDLFAVEQLAYETGDFGRDILR